MHRSVLTAFVIGLLISAPAWGTGVEVITGQVSINQGDGYQPVVDWTPASPGNLVMASPNGAAKIEYDDGCVVEVKPGAVVAVAEQSPCPTGGSDDTGGSGFRPGYLIAGVLVAGGVVGLIALTGGGGDDPASP